MLGAPAWEAWNVVPVRREALLWPAVVRAMESEGPRAPGVRWVQFLEQPLEKVRPLEEKVRPAKELLEPREPPVLELRELPVLELRELGLLEPPELPVLEPRELPVLELRAQWGVRPLQRQRLKVLARRRVRPFGHGEEASAILM